jgi:hypothetical protein
MTTSTSTERCPRDPVVEVDSMGEDEGEDMVKTVATIVATAPKLVIAVGWSYLKLKRQANRCSREMERKLVAEGMPKEFASRLADNFAVEISVRKFISKMKLPGVKIRIHDK